MQGPQSNMGIRNVEWVASGLMRSDRGGESTWCALGRRLWEQQIALDLALILHELTPESEAHDSRDGGRLQGCRS